MPSKTLLTILACLLTLAPVVSAQDSERPKSPRGMASTQVGDAWIDIEYGRPILRGRTNIFGAGEDYGKAISGEGYWRAGADANTMLKTEAALQVGGKKIEAGEYAVLVALDPEEWTLVLSAQETMESWQGYEALDKGLLWATFGYQPKFDAARAPMQLEKLDDSVDQMTISFLDADGDGVTLAIAWENTRATTRLEIVE